MPYKKTKLGQNKKIGQNHRVVYGGNKIHVWKIKGQSQTHYKTLNYKTNRPDIYHSIKSVKRLKELMKKH